MDQHDLPKDYGALIPVLKKILRAAAIRIGRKWTVQSSSAVGSLTLGHSREHTAMVGEFEVKFDEVLDKLSRHRDRGISRQLMEHAELHGEVPKAVTHRIKYAHNEASMRVKDELTRYADLLLRNMPAGPTSMKHSIRPEPEADTPLDADNLLSNMKLQMRADPYTIAGVVFLIGLGTMHMGTAMATLPEEFNYMAYLFLFVNMAVMLVRCSDLFLQERNGPYARALKRIELIISALLITLIIINCAEMVVRNGFDKAWHHCAREIALGGAMVMIFHLFVELAVRRLRDWRDRGKRRW